MRTNCKNKKLVLALILGVLISGKVVNDSKISYAISDAEETLGPVITRKFVRIRWQHLTQPPAYIYHSEGNFSGYLWKVADTNGYYFEGYI